MDDQQQTQDGDEGMTVAHIARMAFRKFLRERPGGLDPGMCGICNDRNAPARVAKTCERCWALERCAMCEAKAEPCEFHQNPATSESGRRAAFMQIAKVDDPIACAKCRQPVTIHVNGVCGACFIGMGAGAGTSTSDAAPPVVTCGLCGNPCGNHATGVAAVTGLRASVCASCVKRAAGLLKVDAGGPPMAARQFAVLALAKARDMIAAVESGGGCEVANAVVTLVEAADRALQMPSVRLDEAAAALAAEEREREKAKAAPAVQP